MIHEIVIFAGYNKFSVELISSTIHFKDNLNWGSTDEVINTLFPNNTFYNIFMFS